MKISTCGKVKKNSMIFNLNISQHILKYVSEKSPLNEPPLHIPLPQPGIKLNERFQFWLNTYTYVHGIVQIF